MVLEAVMICLDNSEYMRNGDYSPTRLQAQTETVNYIINAKIQGNQETTCGMLAMAGERIESHSSPCRNMGALMTALSKDVRVVPGQSDFLAGLKVAKLALKNRPNKNQRQRIIMFVGSPITVTEKKLTQLGGKFKKDNIAVDVINFGAENSTNDNVEKLEKFVAAVNSSDNSHLVNIPPGPHILSDLVLSSAIMSDGSGHAMGGGGGAMGGGAGGGFGGVDADMDPELAMALRISMEEERQRQERATGGPAAEAAATTTDADAPATPAPAAAAAPVAMEDEYEDDDDDEDALLAQAIAMSLAAAGGGNDDDNDDDDADMLPIASTPAPAGPASTPAAPTKPAAAAAPAAATPAATPAAAPNTESDDIAEALQDENFLASLLESVPGVDQDDLALDDILSNLMGGGEEDKDKK